MNGRSGSVKVNRLAGRGVLLVALLLAVLLVAVSGGAVSAAPPLQTPTPEPTSEPAPAGEEGAAGMELGEEIILDQAGFAFSPPVGWQAVDMEQDETSGMVMVAPSEGFSEANVLIVGLGPRAQMAEEADTLQEVGEAAVSSLDDDQVDISEARETFFNEFEALAYDLTGADDTGLEMTGRLLISLVDRDRVFIFMAFSETDKWNEDQVQAVFDSVRLLEPVAGPETEPVDEMYMALLGQEVTETAGAASLTLAPPEGWEILRQEDVFDSRIDLTLLPTGVITAAAPDMRLVLDLDQAWLTGETVSPESLMSGIVSLRQTAALAEGADIVTTAPRVVEVGGVAGVQVDWEKTGAEGAVSQGMLVLALLESAEASPVFIFEASAPREEWDGGLAAAVLSSVSFEGEAQARRFTLKNDGFSFTPPAGWYAEARSLEQGRVVNLSPERAVYTPGFSIGVVSTGFEAGAEASLLAELVAGVLLPDAANGDGLELSEVEEIEVGGLPATVYDLSWPVDGGDQAGGLIVAPLGDGRSLVIAGAAPADDLEMEQIFQNFVGSVALAE